MSDLLPGNEAQRLAALRRYAVLDSPPEPAFDRITRLATKYMKAPIALVSLVDEDRQWFKSAVGLSESETPRAVAFCAHTILEEDPMVVPDAAADPRFMNNPLVTGPPHIRFYAGTRLKSADGFALGTLSVIDLQPRELSSEELAVLIDLGAIAADELELRLALREREQSESLRDLVFNSLEVGISITDEQGTLVEVNPAYCRIFGYTRDELIGKPFAALVLRPKDHARARRIHEAFFRRWTRSSGEWRARRKDGSTVSVYVTGHRFRRHDGRQYAVATATDLTQLKRMEEQLRQSHKMDAIGRLAGGIAHDFNNLLTIILGYGHILTEEVRGTPGEATAREVVRAGDRAAALTRQLLAFSRQQPATTECFNLNNVVAEMEPMLRRLIGEHIALELELDHTLPDVRAERAQSEQILLNLIINARDAMPGGGRINVNTGVRTAGVESPNAIAGLTPGRYVILTVSDTGIGITPEVRARLFEPFFTTKGEGGTGFGLATVYSIVKRFGGEVSVSSTPGLGASFDVYLPVAEWAPEVRPVRAGPGPGPESLRVLLAEDEEALRRLIVRVLESRGHQLRSAPSGQAALEEWRAGGGIDLLITDMVMADMSGVELAEQIAREEPEVRILYISGYTDAVLETPMPHGQRPEFLQKPFTARQLTEAVARLFA